jgi:hypothetical protein
VSPYKVVRLAETHERFLLRQLAVLLRETFPHLEELMRCWLSVADGVERSPRDESSEEADNRTEVEAELERRIALAAANTRQVAAECERGECGELRIEAVRVCGERDLRLMSELKEIVIQAAKELEQHEGLGPAERARPALLLICSTRTVTLFGWGRLPLDSAVQG